MTAKLNICIVTDDYDPAKTGVGNHTQLLSNELTKRGFGVIVLTSKTKDQPSFQIINGIKIYRLPSIKIKGFYQAIPIPWKIKKVLIEEEINIIHHHYLSLLMLMITYIARNLKLRQTATYHFSIDVITQGLLLKPFRTFLQSIMVLCYNQYDLIFTPSHASIKKLKEIGVSTVIKYNSNPINREYDNCLPSKYSNEQFSLLFVGRLSTEKNVSLLIKAFQLVHKANPYTTLYIAGSGPLKSSLIRLTDILGLKNNIEFLGQLNQKELAQHYNKCSALVLPSLLETQPLVILEAMSFGKPVIISSAIEEAKYLVDDNSNGLIFKSNDAINLAQKILNLANDFQLLKKLSLGSILKSKEYQTDKILQKITEEYFSLANNEYIIHKKDILANKLKDLDSPIKLKKIERILFGD